MFDKVWWNIFENTGNIDAYLLYINIKNLKNKEKNEPINKTNVIYQV